VSISLASAEWVDRFTLSIIRAQLPGQDFGLRPDTQIGVRIYSRIGQAFLDLFQYRTEIVYSDNNPEFDTNIVYEKLRSSKNISADDTLEVDILDRGVVVHRASFQFREFLDTYYNHKVIEYSFRRADNGIKGVLYFKVDIFVQKTVFAEVVEADKLYTTSISGEDGQGSGVTGESQVSTSKPGKGRKPSSKPSVGGQGKPSKE